MIEPFSFEGLPHLAPASVERSRVLARALASAAVSRTVSLRGLGPVIVEVRGADMNPWWPRSREERSAPGECTVALWRDGVRGRLEVDSFFALTLVRAALGAPAPAIERRLSPSERGVLASLVAAALVAGGSSSAKVSPEPAPVPSGQVVLIELAVRCGAGAGGARLVVPVSWLETPGAGGAVARPALLETVLRLAIGRTTLERSAVATAAAGDAVVFEGVSALSETGAWPCELSIGAHRARGELLPDGGLRRTQAFICELEDGRDMSSEDDAEKDAATAEAAAVLAAAPVEVVAELGRISLRGDEVTGLVKGAVLPLGPRRRDLVILRVGGRLWARGELVNLDDQLGVRLVEVFRR